MNTKTTPIAENTSALTVTWIALLALSILNYYFAEEMLSGSLLIAVVFGAVFVKLTLVISTFMELRHHGRAWLLPTLGFIGVVCVMLTLTW